MSKRLLHANLITWVVAVYAVSFLLPVTSIGCCSSDMPVLGFLAFLSPPVGFAALFSGPHGSPIHETLSAIGMIAGWAPNPLVWFGLYCLVRRRWLAGAASGLAALLVGLVWIGLGHSLGPGYYVWMASMAVLASGGIFLYFYPNDIKINDTLSQEISQACPTGTAARHSASSSGNESSTNIRQAQHSLLTRRE